ncbi:MAG: hypothetical protein HQ556_02795 [Candidatus Marinimicrobia bacterium]|nr:hypothetical protein [Candidatus Neomarinimicrobiota bacterium]
MSRQTFTLSVFLILSVNLIHGNTTDSNTISSLGFTVGSHQGVQSTRVNNQVHNYASGTDLFGIAIDLEPESGTDFYARMRFGVVPGNGSDFSENLDPSVIFFAGSKSLLGIGKVRVPISVFAISSSHVREQVFSLGSFHYFARHIELLPWMRLKVDFPFSISPLMRLTLPDEGGSLGYGATSTPSVALVFHNLEIGYDLHLGVAKALGNHGSLTYAGWQFNIQWKMVSDS